MDPHRLAAEIDAALRSQALAARAVKEKAYLKSGIDHLGVPVPVTRTIVKEARRRHRDLSHDELVATVVDLWDVPVHERRLAAVELLVLHPALLTADDMGLLERLVRGALTWALVDGLAASVVGPIVEREPSAAAVLDRWAVDDDLWIRRAALLSLLVPLRRGEGDVDRFARWADAMLEEKEFFIRKAIGWVLRDTGRRRPDLVHDWLLPRAGRASGVTVREAVKPLSEAQRRAILAAYTRGQG